MKVYKLIQYISRYMMNIKENTKMALFIRYFVANANIIVQTGKISNETTNMNKNHASDLLI